MTPEELTQTGNAAVNKLLEAQGLSPKEMRAVKKKQRESAALRVCVCVLRDAAVRRSRERDVQRHGGSGGLCDAQRSHAARGWEAWRLEWQS